MEALKQIMRTPKNHELTIKVPQYVPEDELVEVILIIKKKKDEFKRKIAELKQAATDKLFLKDLREVTEDFRCVDLEGWGK